MSNWSLIRIAVLTAALSVFGVYVYQEHFAGPRTFGRMLDEHWNNVPMGAIDTGDYETYQIKMPVCGNPIVGNCVVDGNTLWLDNTRITIKGLHAPKINGRCKAERSLAQTSANRLSELLSAGPFHTAPEGMGLHARALSTVDISSGDLRATMISEGLADSQHGEGADWCTETTAALETNGEQTMDVIARVRHDFNGGFELYSYRATPSEELAQGEALAKKAYGTLASNVKSPATIFMCTWRNPSLKKLDDGRPAEIFLSCNFATEPVKTEQSLVKMAEIYNTIDRAGLKANWTYDRGDYRLSRFSVEINANGKGYRSTNLATEIDEIRVIEDAIEFPRKADDPFRFNLRSALPYRRNSGREQAEPIVSVSFDGIAEPIPRWVNF